MHDTPVVPEVSLPHPRAVEPWSKFQLFEDVGQFAPESLGICEWRELSERTNICHDSGRFQCGSACWEGEHLLWRSNSAQLLSAAPFAQPACLRLGRRGARSCTGQGLARLAWARASTKGAPKDMSTMMRPGHEKDEVQNTTCSHRSDVLCAYELFVCPRRVGVTAQCALTSHTEKAPPLGSVGPASSSAGSRPHG